MGGRGRKIACYRYIQGKSMAGFIYYYGHEQRFFSLPGADESLSLYVPHGCTVFASAKGLLLCRYTDPVLGCTYGVCNPYILGSMRSLPCPPRGPCHPERSALVLVVYRLPVQHHMNYVFHVVCAFPMSARGSHGYFFESYSSRTGWWRFSGPLALGRVRDETGVSAGTRAYWLLRDRASVVYYDALDGTAGTVELPNEYVSRFQAQLEGGPCIRLQSQLGVFDDDLCFVAASGKDWQAVYKYAMADNGYAWSDRIEHRLKAFRGHVMLSRFESDKLQVPFWFYDWKLVVWDHGRWPGRRINVMPVQGPLRILCDNVLPFVHTLLHPVLEFLIF